MKLQLLISLLAGGSLGLAATSRGADQVDFVLDVKPILESTCLSCHGPEKPKGNMRLDTKAGALKGGKNGPALVEGKPDQSPLYKSTILPAGHEDIMPPKGSPLAKTQTEVIRSWIASGAAWPTGVTLKQTPRIDFVKDIQPVL